MKKLIYCATALAMMFFAGSCQQELLETPAGDATVTYTVELPGAATKAEIGDGSNVNQLIYEVWKTGDDGAITNASTRLYQASILIENGAPRKWIVPLNLVQDQYYKVLFWAQVQEADKTVYYNTENLTKVSYAANHTLSNQEKYAAFYGQSEVISTFQSPKPKTVTLIRPFAQLNIGTVNNVDAKEYTIAMSESQVSVKVPTSFNVFSEKVGDVADEPVTFTFATLPAEKYLKVEKNSYEYVAMNYVFAPKGQQLVSDVTYTIKATVNPTAASSSPTEVEIVNTIPSVPLKENFRTNIIGNLLTSSVVYDVIIDAEFDKNSPLDIIEAWNGTEVNAPKQRAEDENIYEIEYASELAWLAAAVNGTLPQTDARAAQGAQTFAGKTFVLTKDVDLCGQEWTPIGSNGKIFKGTFDGQNNTVQNLKITGKNSDVGLFGVTHDGEIKNLVVENAEVSGRLNVGVVAGQPYTSKYSGITVKGDVKVEGMAYVGAVGGKNAYADWTDITVNVNDGSYVKANSVENGTAYRTYVGGVVGFNGEGGHKFSNITSNIDVEGSTCDVGGLFGIAHYGNKFENCVCTGNVKITTTDVEDALEMGGIAGVWNNGEDVVFTNCKFEGELSAPNAGTVDFYYNGLIGKPYSANGTGKLIIDGVQYVASATELQRAVDAATESVTIKFGADIEGDVMICEKNNVVLTIDGDQNNYKGTIKIHNGSAEANTGKVNIKNVNFVTDSLYENAKGELVFDFIMPNDFGVIDGVTCRYSQDVTVEDCSFTATGDAKHVAVGVQAKSSKNLKVINCTATDMHSLVQAQSCDETVLVEGCTITAKNGVAFGNATTATIKNTTITALGYGVRADGTNAREVTLTVTGCTIDAFVPVTVRYLNDASVKKVTVNVDASNKLTKGGKYDVSVGATEYKETADPTKPVSEYNIDNVDAGFVVYPRDYYHPVETWEEFTAALGTESKVKFTKNITYEGAKSYDLKKDVVVDLNNMTFTTGNMNTTWLNIMGSKATFKNGVIEGKVYVQKNSSIYSDATFENVTFGGTITFSEVTQGSLAVQGGNSVYAKSCTFKAKGSTKPNIVSLEGTSRGTVAFEDCTFNSSMNRFYANPIGGTAVFKLVNCSFNKAAVVETNANWDLNNMTITGSKTSGVNLYVGKAKDNLTAEEKAILDAYKKNNKGTVYCNSVKY